MGNMGRSTLRFTGATCLYEACEWLVLGRKQNLSQKLATACPTTYNPEQ